MLFVREREIEIDRERERERERERGERGVGFRLSDSVEEKLNKTSRHL